jgi:hypothetical protein
VTPRDHAEGRPAVDVVVPFRGTAAEREALLARLGGLDLREQDTLVVVDNGPGPITAGPRVISAPEVPSSYYARNRGAGAGEGEWLLFIDADVFAPADLIDRYFAVPPAPDVAVLAGAVHDEGLGDPAALDGVARFAALTAAMSQHNTLGEGDEGYAQTANCAVRRVAFEQIGGFRTDIRSGGDADLCFRIRDAGWRLESRAGAAIEHRNRTTLRALVRQLARHGSGGAWLDRRYPGSFPPDRSLRTVAWSARDLVVALWAWARGDGDRALVRSVGVVSHWAFELGRLLPNRPPRRRRP